jgi:hypothetical protein
VKTDDRTTQWFWVNQDGFLRRGHQNRGLEDDTGRSCKDLEEQNVVQRSWVMEEQQGGPCGWSRGSKGDRGRRRQGGDRQVVQGPVGCREDLGFEPEGGGSHGGLWDMPYVRKKLTWQLEMGGST